MNKTKRGYEAPTSELLVVRFEHAFLTGSDTANAPTGLPSYTQDYDDWD